MKGASLSKIVETADSLFPFSLAEKWDNCGVQIGDLSATVTSIAFALDPSMGAIDFAAHAGAELLITHHPLILDPIRTIMADEFIGGVILRAARTRTAIVSLHTNFDAAEGGLNDHLAEKIGLSNIITPDEASCARLGRLPAPSIVSVLARRVSSDLDIPHLRAVYTEDSEVRTVFLASGSGMGYLGQALALNADVMVTGDVRYHAAQEAKALSIPVIDAGHYGLEKFAPTLLAKSFQQEFSQVGLDIPCILYDGETEPFRLISPTSGGVNVERSVGAVGKSSRD